MKNKNWYESFQKHASDLYPGRYTPEFVRKLEGQGKEIKRLADEKKSTIVAHNYLFPEFHEIADMVGDSLALSFFVRDKGGETAATVYRGLAGIYNVYSEQADLRSWQTQPSQIRIGRLTLAPGEYVLKVETLDEAGGLLETIDLGQAELAAGQKRFFVIRTSR